MKLKVVIAVTTILLLLGASFQQEWLPYYEELDSRVSTLEGQVATLNRAVIPVPSQESWVTGTPKPTSTTVPLSTQTPSLVPTGTPLYPTGSSITPSLQVLEGFYVGVWCYQITADAGLNFRTSNSISAPKVDTKPLPNPIPKNTKLTVIGLHGKLTTGDLWAQANYGPNYTRGFFAIRLGTSAYAIKLKDGAC